MMVKWQIAETNRIFKLYIYFFCHLTKPSQIILSSQVINLFVFQAQRLDKVVSCECALMIEMIVRNDDG